MIFLSHSKSSPNLNIDAIYFGDSYSKFKNLENKFPYKFKRLKKQTIQGSKLEKFFFLDWIEKKRKANKDSIFWWMNHLAGRNNLQSKLFLYLCQFNAIQRYIKSSKNKNILIICENFYLLKFLEKNLNLKFKVYKNANYYFTYVYDFLKDSFFKNLSRIKSLIKIFLNFLFAYISRPRGQKKPAGKIVLFHHCVDGRVTNVEKKNICNYFTHLPYLIKTNNFSDTYGLFWAYNYSFSLKFFKEMRGYKTFIPQDWLGPLDIIKIFFNLIKIKKNLKNYVTYKNKINLDNLIDYEIFNQNTLDCFNFLCYIPALKKWSSNLKKLTIMDQYQNMVFEHSLRFAAKKLPIPTKSIGYHHCLVSRDFLGYHSLKSEWKSLVKPDVILTTGKFGENFLHKGGIPKKKITQFYSLRQKKIIKSKKDKKKILILLPIFLESCFEILDMLINTNQTIKKNNYKIYIKTHPMVDKSKIVKFFSEKKIDQKWKWSNKNLHDELKDTYLVITSSSASVYDAIMSNCITIVFKNELTQFDNYLDVFSIVNKNIKSFNKNEIENFLKNEFKFKSFKNNYTKKIALIRNILIKQTNFFTKKNLFKIKKII